MFKIIIKRAKKITFALIWYMKKSGTIFFIIFFCLSCFSHARNFAAPKHEYRAVWLTVIENLDWPSEQTAVPFSEDMQKNELRNILDSLKALNVNCVMLQTRVRGDLIYPSRLEPFSYLFTGVPGSSPGYDPLAFAIEECHKRGMQLHAWVVTLPLGKDEHIAMLGEKALPHRDRDLCTRYGGAWYMEPGNPATSAYITGIVKEIVSNYDIDGIHLDYVRYPDKTDGYPDTELFRKYGGGLSLAQWRRSNITRIVRDVYACVKSVKPWVRVSCAPLGKYDNLTRYGSMGWDALNTCYQEAQEWLREGVMDILFPMLYFKGNHFYPFVRDWQENACGRHVVPGIGIYRLLPEYGGWDKSEISRQLFTSRAAGCAGTAVFRSSHLTGNVSGVCDVYFLAYRYPALVPPMTWHGSSVEPPCGLAVEPVEYGYRIRWNKVEPASGLPAVRYNVYVCYGDSVDTDDPKNLLSVMQDSAVCEWRCRKAPQITFAVTAVDAYGVESEPVEACCVINALQRESFLGSPVKAGW